MAVSGIYTYSINRDTLLQSVFRTLGVFNNDAPAPPTDVQNAAEALNLMLKAWMADGRPLWCMADITIPLILGQGGPGVPYVLGQGGIFATYKPLRIQYARLHYGATNNDVQLTELSRSEYNLLGSKTSSGVPNSFYFDPQTNYANLQVYVTPDAYNATNNTIILTVQRPIQDMTSALTDFDMPIECLNAVKWCLCDELAMEYDIPDTKTAVISAKAKRYFSALWDFSVEEASTSFQPDMTRR